MNNFKVGSCLTLAVLLSLGVSGCSSTKEKNAPEKTRMLGVPSASVETDPQILSLEAAVRKSPNAPEAWNSLTKAYFENKQYDKAVQVGNISLQLNPENPDIRNIVFVSGLRIASSSLDGIRKDQPLSGSNLTDAEKLVSGIRQSLGETSLTESSSTKITPVKTTTARTPMQRKIRKKAWVSVAKSKVIEAVRKPVVDVTPATPKLFTAGVPKTAPVVITNKPIAAAPKPAAKPGLASGSNPFGAFQ